MASHKLWRSFVVVECPFSFSHVPPLESYSEQEWRQCRSVRTDVFHNQTFAYLKINRYLPWSNIWSCCHVGVSDCCVGCLSLSVSPAPSAVMTSPAHNSNGRQTEPSPSPSTEALSHPDQRLYASNTTNIINNIICHITVVYD